MFTIATQQRSWSTGRSIWSNILSYFLPYLHEEIPISLIGDRLDEFIKALDDKIKSFDKSNADGQKSQVSDAAKNEIRLIRKNFDEIRRNYRKGFQKDDLNKGSAGKKRGARDLLFQSIEGTWSKNKTPNYFAKGLENVNKELKTNNPKLKSLDNIYLDFYIAASKPQSLRDKNGPLGNGFKIFCESI